jgi:hypothetical protein
LCCQESNADFLAVLNSKVQELEGPTSSKAGTEASRARKKQVRLPAALRCVSLWAVDEA